MRPVLLALTAAAAMACQTMPAAPRTAVPLGPDEGELYVYLGTTSHGPRWTMTVSSVVAVAADGTRVPLAVASRKSIEGARHEKLLASGPVPARSYVGVEVGISGVELYGRDGASALVPPQAPLLLRRGFSVSARQGSVMRIAPRDETSSEGMEFTSALDLLLVERPATANVSYSSHPELDRLTLLDKAARRVVAVIPTGGAPRGIALDARRSQAYVAMQGEDEIVVLDSATGAVSGRVELSPRDAPGDAALTPDGRTLIVIDHDADAVSFIDAGTHIETSRVLVTEDPQRLLLDRPGARAYVLLQRPPAVAVLDVTSRALVTTVPLDAEPVWADLDRSGRRLYVTHRGSPHVTIVSLPGLTASGRMFVGGGAGVVKVDARTDLIYVARADAPFVDVYDPLSLLSMDSIRLPAPAAVLAIDDVENAMWALAGEQAVLGIVDLTTKTLVSVIDLPGPGFDLALVGER